LRGVAVGVVNLLGTKGKACYEDKEGEIKKTATTHESPLGRV